MRSDDPRRADLEAAGWVVAAHSWAAQLAASHVEALSGSVQRAHSVTATAALIHRP